MLGQLNMLLKLYANITINTLFTESAWGALQIWVMLLMQLGYDTGVYGLSDAGNLLSALSRELRLLVWRHNVQQIPNEAVMKPLWKALSHWRKLEPYDFRFPIPLKAVQALMGVAVLEEQWLLLLFIMITHHCWMRPGETLALKWDHICINELLDVHGVVCIHNPKIRTPNVQHVIVECPIVAKVATLIKDLCCSNVSASVFAGWSPFTLHKKWSHCVATLGLHILVKTPHSLNTHITPGGLRSSGATGDFMRHENLSRVKWRGRWATDSVLKHYLQLGIYHLASLQFAASARARIDKYSLIWETFSQNL